MLTPGSGVARRRPRRRRVVSRGAADPRRVPAQAAAAVHPRQRGRRSGPLGARRRRRRGGRSGGGVLRAGRICRGGRRARVLLLLAPRRARLRPGRRPRPELPHRLLRAAHTRPAGGGETVLVQGAAGGVGTATLQVAKGLGARTIAVVSSDDKERVAREAGADEVVRSDGPWKDQVKEISGGGVDVVIDPVGGDRFTDNLRSLREGGRAVVVGFTGGSIPEVRVNRLLLEQHRGGRRRLGSRRDGQTRRGARDRRRDRRPDHQGVRAAAGRRPLPVRAGGRRAEADRRARSDRQGRPRGLR